MRLKKNLLPIFIILLFTNCKKTVSPNGKPVEKTALQATANRNASGSLASCNFSANGGNWEYIWLHEGDPGESFYLPHDFIYENSLIVDCHGTPVSKTITYADVFQSVRVKHNTNGDFKHKTTFLDLDPVPELSNCNHIHYRRTTVHSDYSGDWNYNTGTNTLRWQFKIAENDAGIPIYNIIEGTVEFVSDNKFYLTGTSSFVATGNSTTTIPCKYLLRKI